MKIINKHIMINMLLLSVGICVGALVMWNMGSPTDSGSPAGEQLVDFEDTEEYGEKQKVEIIELQEVDYPFGHETEGWRLVLCTKRIGYGSSYLFRMYNRDGVLLQEFACNVSAKELLFRHDGLYSYYGGYRNLEVFPADAEETCARGLLFSWDNETKRFGEEPMEIAWYEEVESRNAYLAKSKEGNKETVSVYRMNEETMVPVELRRWVLTKPGAYSEESTGHLCIWDCLEKVALYDGEVEWSKAGYLENEKYYQDLLWWDLDIFLDYKEDTEIPVAKMVLDKDGKAISETMTYKSREELLADSGFMDAEPFYLYYDNFQNLQLELYFDEREEKGCGFLYSYRFSYQLEKIVYCKGFIFEGVSVEEWEPEDTFSTLSHDGEYAGEMDVLGYREIYEYTDEGKLSSFEARGILYWYGKEDEEESLLSMNYMYRNDGTLYRKEYHHHAALFGTFFQSQYSDYDELGRLVCNIGYITHGYMDYYYIYEDEGEKPDYFICFDEDGGYIFPVMTVYK